MVKCTSCNFPITLYTEPTDLFTKQEGKFYHFSCLAKLQNNETLDSSMTPTNPMQKIVRRNKPRGKLFEICKCGKRRDRHTAIEARKCFA